MYSAIHHLSESKVLSLLLFSVALQPGSCQTWLKTFLASRLKYASYEKSAFYTLSCEVQRQIPVAIPLRLISRLKFYCADSQISSWYIKSRFMDNSATIWFEAYLVVYPKDTVSHNEAQKIDLVTILQYRFTKHLNMEQVSTGTKNKCF